MKTRCRLVAISAVIALLVLLGYGSTPAAAVVWTGANPAPLGNPITPMASPAPDSTWYLPMVFKSYYGWDSRITVANPSTQTSVNVWISIYATGNPNPVFDGEMSANGIPLGGTYSVPMTQFGLASGFYSARVRGHVGIYEMPIVAYAENYAQNGSTGTYSTQEYHGVPASATALYNGAAHVPFIYDQNGWGTGVAVQNVGSATANFTVHYYGYGCTDGPFSIPPGAAVSVYPGCVGSSGVNTSAWVTNSGNQNTAVVVSQTGPHGIARAFSVADGFRFTSSTPVPILADHWQNANTAIACVNTDSTSGTITVNYASGGSSQVTVPQGGPATILQSGTGVYPAGSPNTISSTKYVNCVVAGESFYADGQGWDGVWGYTINNKAYDQPPAVGVAAAAGGVNAVTKTKARWYLNWSTGATQGMPSDVEFVPMYGGTGSVYLMGANEPNRGDQSHVCPQDYVPTWYQIEQTYSTRKLVSPGVAGPGSSVWCSATQSYVTLTGEQWITQFRTAFYNSYHRYPRFDALGYHTLGSMTWGPARVSDMTTQFENLAIQWGISEIWLDEYDSWSSMTPADLRGALDWLATQPQVTRIAYYQDNTQGIDTAPLVDASGNLTAVGRAYWLYR